MAERIILQIPYKGSVRSVEAELRLTGYTHRFVVKFDDTEIHFEPDEERNYRAIVYDGPKDFKADQELLAGIIAELENALK